MNNKKRNLEFENGIDPFQKNLKKIKIEKPKTIICLPYTPSTGFFSLNQEPQDGDRASFQIQKPITIKIPLNTIYVFNTLTKQEARSILSEKIKYYESRRGQKDIKKKTKKLSRNTKKLKKKMEFIERRKKIIDSYLLGQKIKYISDQLNENYNFISDTISDFKRLKHVNTRMKGRPSKITEKDELFLINYLEKRENSFKSKNMFLEELKSEYIKNNIESEIFKKTTVANLFKKLKITYKRTCKFKIETNSEKIINSRFEIALHYAKYLSLGYKFIYMDETSFNSNMECNYGYSKAGSKCVVQKIKRKYNISAIAAIDEDEFLGIMLFKGSIKARDVGYFIGNLIKNNEKIKGNLNKYIIYFDNASIHKSKILKSRK